MAAVSSELASKKILMIGAGGIGCELLKTLVLSGFKEITILDMDTIETSNLNRQFLFRRRHVGDSKSKVARESVLRFRPDANIVAHCANVKESQYDVAFFSQYSIVLNGLDNLDARRHVNRICLAANVPLVESGTAGYLGQVTTHLGGEMACYECTAKTAPKSYPVCTIRNTPDRPIHCIVWAKDMLFNTLFGPETPSDLEEQEAGAAGAEEEEAKETAEEVKERQLFFKRREGEAAAAFLERVFARVFGSDIERLLKMEEMWAKPGRLKPAPLAPAVAEAARAAVAAAGAGAGAKGAKGSAAAALGLTDNHKLWTPEENASVFQLSGALLAERQLGEPLLFDKDDGLAVEFVTSASNLRSANYSIPVQSLFTAKGMAGNIIHAIATTNAIISGFIVIEAIKILRGAKDKCKWMRLAHDPTYGKVITGETPLERNKGCYVCGTARVQVTLDTSAWTLADLVSKVVRGRMGLSEPTINSAVTTLYETGEGLDAEEVANFEKLSRKKLDDLPGGGVRDGTTLEVEDFSQHLKVHVLVRHRAEWDAEKEPDAFELAGEVPTGVASAHAGAAAAAAADDDDDDIEVLDADQAAEAAKQAQQKASSKRKAGDDASGAAAAEGGGGGAAAKRAKKAAAVAAAEEDGVVLLDD